MISNIALHWGTLHRTIRTKDAAIAWFGAQQRLAARAFVEVLAGVSRHRFALGEAANRAYQRGFQKKLAHTSGPTQQTEAPIAASIPATTNPFPLRVDCFGSDISSGRT